MPIQLTHRRLCAILIHGWCFILELLKVIKLGSEVILWNLGITKGSLQFLTGLVRAIVFFLRVSLGSLFVRYTRNCAKAWDYSGVGGGAIIEAAEA